MRDFFKYIADCVFSFGMFLFLVCAGFFYVLYAVFDSDMEREERVRQLTDACYSQGMVLIDTDAGKRCADPRTLVKVK